MMKVKTNLVYYWDYDVVFCCLSGFLRPKSINLFLNENRDVLVRYSKFLTVHVQLIKPTRVIDFITNSFLVPRSLTT